MISSTIRLSIPAVTRPCRSRILAPRIPAISHRDPVSPTYRHLSCSARAAYPRKDSQHKDSINTEATEYSKSGTDDEGARQEDAAFNPDITDPQDQKDVAGKGTGGGTVSYPPPFDLIVLSLCIHIGKLSLHKCYPITCGIFSVGLLMCYPYRIRIIHLKSALQILK